ncbi:unnamed protein product [Sympodiomycopsis kandeliae]
MELFFMPEPKALQGWARMYFEEIQTHLAHAPQTTTTSPISSWRPSYTHFPNERVGADDLLDEELFHTYHAFGTEPVPPTNGLRFHYIDRQANQFATVADDSVYFGSRHSGRLFHPLPVIIRHAFLGLPRYHNRLSQDSNRRLTEIWTRSVDGCTLVARLCLAFQIVRSEELDALLRDAQQYCQRDFDNPDSGDAGESSASQSPQNSQDDQVSQKHSADHSGSTNVPQTPSSPARSQYSSRSADPHGTASDNASRSSDQRKSTHTESLSSDPSPSTAPMAVGPSSHEICMPSSPRTFGNQPEQLQAERVAAFRTWLVAQRKLDAVKAQSQTSDRRGNDQYISHVDAGIGAVERELDSSEMEASEHALTSSSRSSTSSSSPPHSSSSFFAASSPPSQVLSKVEERAPLRHLPKVVSPQMDVSSIPSRNVTTLQDALFNFETASQIASGHLSALQGWDAQGKLRIENLPREFFRALEDPNSTPEQSVWGCLGDDDGDDV